MTPLFFLVLACGLPVLVIAIVYGVALALGVAPDYALIVLTLPLMGLLLYALSALETRVEREHDLPDSLWKRLASFARGDDEDERQARDLMDPEERQQIAKQLLVFSVAGLAWAFTIAFVF